MENHNNDPCGPDYFTSDGEKKGFILVGVLTTLFFVVWSFIDDFFYPQPLKGVWKMPEGWGQEARNCIMDIGGWCIDYTLATVLYLVIASFVGAICYWESVRRKQRGKNN